MLWLLQMCLRINADRRLLLFKFRRREGYHRKVGHRQGLTVLQIKEIRF